MERLDLWFKSCNFTYLYGTMRFSWYKDSNLGSLLRDTTVRIFSMASVAICREKNIQMLYLQCITWSVFQQLLLELSPTFPAFSSSFLSSAACPVSSFISAAPATAMMGTTAKMSRVSSQPYTKEMITPVPMLAKFCVTVARRAPVAWADGNEADVHGLH